MVCGFTLSLVFHGRYVYIYHKLRVYSKQVGREMVRMRGNWGDRRHEKGTKGSLFGYRVHTYGDRLPCPLMFWRRNCCWRGWRVMLWCPCVWLSDSVCRTLSLYMTKLTRLITRISVPTGVKMFSIDCPARPTLSCVYSLVKNGNGQWVGGDETRIILISVHTIQCRTRQTEAKQLSTMTM